MVPQDVPQLQLAAAAAEALPRTGGGAGLQQLVGRAQAGAGGAAAPGRREPADGGRAPPGTPAALRAGRAPGRGTGGGRSCATVGYLERNEPLPLDQPDRKATSFITSHFYLDDFVQSSEDPNPQPLQHTPLQAIPEEGFRAPAEATDEDVRLARRYQGGNRFGEDDLAGDPEAGALASNGQGPPSITDRLRSTADSAQAAADLIGAGAAGLAAAQAFRSQLPQDAAEYVRLNVLPRPGPAQPPPQIIGRPSDVERLLDEAGQRAQEVERGAEAIEETAAVAAEEGEVAVAAEGVGGAFGWRKEQQHWRPPRASAGTLAGAAGVGAAATAGLAVGIAGGAAYGLARGTGWVLENTLFRPQQGSEDAAVQDVRSANGMNDATQPQHFTLRSSSRASSQSGFRVQAQSNNTPRPFSWGLNPVALPQSQPSSRASSSSGRRSLPPPSFDQLARDIEAA